MDTVNKEWNIKVVFITFYKFSVTAKPSNGYRPDEPYRITFLEDAYTYQNEGYAKLNVRSGGADSPRQIVLRRKGEQWFLWEQYILVGIRTPSSEDEWS